MAEFRPGAIVRTIKTEEIGDLRGILGCVTVLDQVPGFISVKIADEFTRRRMGCAIVNLKSDVLELVKEAPAHAL